jgi:hypothetical protein
VKRVSEHCFEVYRFDGKLVADVIYRPQFNDWSCDCYDATFQIGKGLSPNCKHIRLVWRVMKDGHYKIKV